MIYIYYFLNLNKKNKFLLRKNVEMFIYIAFNIYQSQKSI